MIWCFPNFQTSKNPATACCSALGPAPLSQYKTFSNCWLSLSRVLFGRLSGVKISYKCLDIVAGSSCGVVAVDLEQSSEDGRSCVFSGDGSNIWKDRMAKSEGKAAGSLGTTRETKRCEGERERRRECGHKWGIDWTYNN